jgi:small conductance mechanosensitive channel
MFAGVKSKGYFLASLCKWARDLRHMVRTVSLFNSGPRTRRRQGKSEKGKQSVIHMDSEYGVLAFDWALRVAFAALILGVGLWFAYFVSRIVRRHASRHPHVDTTLGSFFALVIRYAIIAIVLIAVLQKFGVETTSLVAMLGAGALAVGLALQGTLGNVASGIMLAFIRPYRIGDFVDLNGHEGTIVNLDLFFTEIYTLDDRRIFVPNGEAVANPIVNYTSKNLRRCVIVFGVGYDDDIDKVLDVLRATMTADPRVVAKPAPWFGVDSLGEYSVNISARTWTKTADYFQYRADMLHAVKEAFDREGIDLPYPHSVELSKGEVELRLPPIKPARTSGKGQRRAPSRDAA